MNPAPPRPDTKSFATPHWSLLQQIQTQPRGSAKAQAALQRLRDLYGPPVLAALEHVLPHQRYPDVDAAQLAQEFFVSLTNAAPAPCEQQSDRNFRNWLKQQLLEFCKQYSAPDVPHESGT